MRKTFSHTLIASVAFFSGCALAAEKYGTAEEAKAMLQKAVAQVKVDKAKALDMFTKGEGGFKDRDLYPYCGGPDGKFTAHPRLVGQSLKDLQDKANNPIGAVIYAKAQEGTISEMEYQWPRPNETEPVQKVVFYTKVSDQFCAVGYYK